MRKISIKGFITETLIEGNEKIFKNKFTYQAFALESIAIEFLGKVLSGKPLDTTGESKRNFKNAIKTLFPKEYHQHADILYTELRCGMLHFFGPKSKIALGESEKPGESYHLSFTPKGKLILLFKEFHRDFKMAANELFQSKKASVQTRLKKVFLRVNSSNFI